MMNLPKKKQGFNLPKRKRYFRNKRNGAVAIFVEKIPKNGLLNPYIYKIVSPPTSKDYLVWPPNYYSVGSLHYLSSAWIKTYWEEIEQPKTQT